jgi:hypothetical protein
MIVQLKIIGGFFVVLAVLHFFFPRYFGWNSDLKPLSLINRQMMWVHTFFLAFIVFLMGLLCLFETQALLNTDLGQSICIGLGVFWGLRLLVQFFGYSSKLWRGKIFETSVHIVFILIWGYLTFLFLWIGFVL